MRNCGLRPARAVAPVAVCVALVLLFVPVPTAWLGVWHGQLLDFGHVPLFAVLFLALRVGAGGQFGRPLLAALTLAGLVELVQPAVGRTGDWKDFLRGALGVLAAALAARAWAQPRPRARALAHALLAAGCLVWPGAEVAPYLADTVAGRRAFPVLAAFSTDRELLRWECVQAALSRDGTSGCRVEFLTGPAEYPGAWLRPAVGDFGGAGWLCCEFEVVGPPLDLVISVRTGAGAGGTTHADVGRRYPAGTHTARLDLAALAARGRPERLVLADVRSVAFFLIRPREPRTLVLRRVWLEP